MLAQAAHGKQMYWSEMQKYTLRTIPNTVLTNSNKIINYVNKRSVLIIFLLLFFLLFF